MKKNWGWGNAGHHRGQRGRKVEIRVVYRVGGKQLEDIKVGAEVVGREVKKKSILKFFS